MISVALFLPSPPAGAGQPAARPLEHRLRPVIERKLSEALPLAESRLREHASCGRLFADLGHDGLAALERIRFTSASFIEEQRICRNRASAFTAVGHPITRICRSFARLPANRAAVVVLHEALHYAGMTERPADPEALASAGINRLVAKSCRL